VTLQTVTAFATDSIGGEFVSDPPPFQSPRAQPLDREMTAEEREKGTKRREKKAERDANQVARGAQEGNIAEEDEDRELPFIIPGYAGKNKGIFQVLDIYLFVRSVFN
jgi:hypothetical protein